MFDQPDWHLMFSPSDSLLDVIIRGTIMYLFIFVLTRVVRRETGSISVADLLVVVLIADAAQNGMAGDYTSVPEGMVLVCTIVGWSLVVDWAAYNFEAIGSLLHPRPVELVHDGVPQRRHLRANLITMDELMTHVRQAGVETIDQVRRAWLEGNGEISVVLKEGAGS